MVKKCPKLYSARQVAAILGKPVASIKDALLRGRIIGAHRVDSMWVIQEDFRIKRAGVNDALVSNLPPELISEVPEKDFDAPLPEFKPSGKGGGVGRQVQLPGFARVTEGMTGNEIRRLTGVHNQTQTRIKKGEYVNAKVALRLARKLNIDVEELLS